MASADVMPMMPVETKDSRRGAAAAGDSAGAQDVYIKLKSLQKHMEFLDIQVGSQSGRRGLRVFDGSAGECCCFRRLGKSIDFGVHSDAPARNQQLRLLFGIQKHTGSSGASEGEERRGGRGGRGGVMRVVLDVDCSGHGHFVTWQSSYLQALPGVANMQQSLANF